MYILTEPNKNVLTFIEYKKIDKHIILLYGDEIIGKKCFLVMNLSKDDYTESEYKLYFCDNMDYEDIIAYNGNACEIINTFKDREEADNNELVKNWEEEYNVLKIAEVIKNNTTSHPLKDWIEDMILNVHLAKVEIDDYLYLYDVFKFIMEDGYNISNFEFYELPHELVYVFYNDKTNEMFDIIVEEYENDFKIFAEYLNDDRQSVKTKNIKEAIDGFKTSNWDK